MADSQLERLIIQCRSNDVDAKIDAVTKLQAEFEAGAEITETDGLLTVLKACLRTPNQHLTTATVSALPPLIPLLVARNASGLHASSSTSPVVSTSSTTSAAIDVPMLRQVLHALLPAGGVIERLGDSRERARDKARETLVVLGGFAFRCSTAGSSLRAKEGKGPETPLMIFERCLKEGGLGSKVPRVREQAILTLVNIRRAHHLFPIRPYLLSLVETLEDSDPSVRECAKTSVVELFTGPGVTDAARADLKKELTKKGVRKTIVDYVLTKVLAAGAGSAMSETGSENGDAAQLPSSTSHMSKRPGMASAASSMSRSVSQPTMERTRPASRSALVSPVPPEGAATSGGGSDVKAVYIASGRDLENEFASMLKHFEGKETEHNWAAREKAVLRVRGMLKGDIHERYHETFMAGLKQGFMEASLKTLHSLRTTVAANTLLLFTELATALGTALDPFCDLLYNNLIKMASLTKKIIAQQSQTVVDLIITSTSPQTRVLLPTLWNGLQDKAMQTRAYAVGHLKVFLEAHCVRARHSIESAGGVETLEKCLKKGLADANPGVRETTRQAFWVFESVWRDRGRALLDTLDATARKQLEKACPDPDLLAVLAPATLATPQTKKQSVAAAIAASRAKAKAIATAPPSLRHQATSAARTISPPQKRPGSPSLSNSQSNGSVSASAASSTARVSPPARPRVVSGGALSRSTGSGFVPNRDVARQTVPASPPSPTPESTFRRRLSSPLAGSPTSSSTLRRAVQTALPASPPQSSVLLQPGFVPRTQSQRNIPRDSVNIMGMHELDDESLLLASNIPIPEDSDSDMDIDMSVNLISFSTPYEMYPPERAVPQARSAASFSPRSSGSRPPLSNALSTGTSSPPAGVPQPMVEDAMRARAEQAESAAERLLELVDPDEDGSQSSTLPSSLLLRSIATEATPRLKSRASAGSSHYVKNTAGPRPPKTPVSKNAATVRKAALFQDSPAYTRKTATSIFDMINGQTNDSVWWSRRLSLINEWPSVAAGGPSEREQQLNDCIAALEQGPADVLVLKQLAHICRQNPVNEPISPISPDFSDPLSPSPVFGGTRGLPSLKPDLWHQNKAFERLFRVLMEYLDPTRTTSELEYGLIVLWEMLEFQAPLLEGRETDVFAALLRVRYSGHSTVMQATTTFRDALTSRIEPVYGLTTMHASIRAFRDAPLPPLADTETKNGTFAFGLIALGKFILRLPAEILEEELPRLRATLTSALTDMTSETSLVVREAAAASIIAAQLVLQNEAHLFALLDGLPEDKKNLLTYLFDKHGCRSSTAGPGLEGKEKLEREMRRLDGRTSTPLRPSGVNPFVST